MRDHNVVLISIDTLRADHLGSYGYPIATSPKIDAIATGPNHEGARYCLGHVLLSHHPVEDVVAYYQQTVDSAPKPQTSYYFWGQALAKAGDREGALGIFQDAITADPTHELSEVAWGALLERQGSLEEALTHYERAVHIHPELTNALEG